MVTFKGQGRFLASVIGEPNQLVENLLAQRATERRPGIEVRPPVLQRAEGHIIDLFPAVDVARGVVDIHVRQSRHVGIFQ